MPSPDAPALPSGIAYLEISAGFLPSMARRGDAAVDSFGCTPNMTPARAGRTAQHRELAAYPQKALAEVPVR